MDDQTNAPLEGPGDAAHLASLEAKLQVTRDRTRGLVKGFYDGVYIHGAGGVGKSHAVETTLAEVARELGRNLDELRILTNSRITAKALFAQLRDNPTCVHVFEDVEGLLKDSTAAGVLRSALWGQPGPDEKPVRKVTWKTAAATDEFVFEGGILMLANSTLPDLPEMAAAQTRFVYHHVKATVDELAAKMRELAGRGHAHGDLRLTPAECLEVANEVVAKSRDYRRPLNLRLFRGALQDRLQWQTGESRTHWLDLVDARVREQVTTPARRPADDPEREDLLLEVSRRVQALPPSQQLALWRRETGMSRASMFRWRNRLLE